MVNCALCGVVLLTRHFLLSTIDSTLASIRNEFQRVDLKANSIRYRLTFVLTNAYEYKTNDANIINCFFLTTNLIVVYIFFPLSLFMVFPFIFVVYLIMIMEK